MDETSCIRMKIVAFSHSILDYLYEYLECYIVFLMKYMCVDVRQMLFYLNV